MQVLRVEGQRVSRVVNQRFASDVKGLQMATLLELIQSVPHDFPVIDTDAGDALLRHPRSSPGNDDSRIANSQSSDKSIWSDLKGTMELCREAHGSM